MTALEAIDRLIEAEDRQCAMEVIRIVMAPECDHTPIVQEEGCIGKRDRELFRAGKVEAEIHHMTRQQRRATLRAHRHQIAAGGE